MRYLVTGKYVEPGPLLPPDKLVDMVENVVMPSLAALSKMQADGKVVAGGIHAGGRVGTSIVEAESNKEVDELIGSLPFWGLLQWTVTPLVSYDERAAWEGERIKELKEKIAG